MVDDEREVLVLALPGNLVDPDLEQAVKPAGIKILIADPFDDPSDRVPVDPQHPLERRLVNLGSQPRDQTLEIPGELRARPRERDRLGQRPMLRAPQPPAPAMDLKRPDAQVQMAPDRVHRPLVLARPREYEHFGQTSFLRRSAHLDDHPIGLEPNLLDPHARQAHKPGKCRRDAHAVPPCKPLTSSSQQPARSGAARHQQCATSENFFSRRKTCSNAQSGSHGVHIESPETHLLRSIATTCSRTERRGSIAASLPPRTICTRSVNRRGDRREMLEVVRSRHAVGSTWLPERVAERHSRRRRRGHCSPCSGAAGVVEAWISIQAVATDVVKHFRDALVGAKVPRGARRPAV